MNDIKNTVDSFKSLVANLKTLNRYRLVVHGCNNYLDVESFTAIERLSGCYKYKIKFTTTAQDLEPNELLRNLAAFTFISTKKELNKILEANEAEKVVYGLVTNFKRLGGSVDQAEYELTLEPNLSLLRHQHYAYRFFLNKSVPQVIEQILSEHKLPSSQFKFDLKYKYPQRAQITQVNESDLAFIERLLAELGIYYYFDISPELNKEVVYFSDKQKPYAQDLNLPFNSPSGLNDKGGASIWGLSLRHQVVASSVQVKDYNYKESQNILLTPPIDMSQGARGNINYGEVYKYKAGHSSNLVLNTNEESDTDNNQPLAETLDFWARLEHERLLSGQTHLRATSNETKFKPGLIFIVSNSSTNTLPAIFNSPIRITSLRLRASRAQALSISLSAVPYSPSLNWRPALKVKPQINGTLVARIAKKPNASTDFNQSKPNTYSDQNNEGLYWVKFDADLDKRLEGEASSMPVRLAKSYAGDTYGLHLPLIEGTEVAIAFNEGNPDSPYIAHALHDSRHPDLVTSNNNTRNVLRTPANNKLRMEDKQGKEHIKLSTEYGGKSQLNLGHLVNSKGEQRGEGFELRTDAWGAIRAGKGLFISADEQVKAGSKMLANYSAQSHLEYSYALTRALMQSVQTSGADVANVESQNEFNEKIKQMDSAGVLVSAPDGIGLVSNDNIQLSSGDNIILTSKSNTDLSIMQRLTVAAGEAISFFAHKLGIKIYAARGKVDIQAQTDAMRLQSQKKLEINSVNDEVFINADKGITLVSQGAYIKIKNGAIELGAPGVINIKSDKVNVGGAANLEQSLTQYKIEDPEYKYSLSKRFRVVDKATKEPRVFVPYSIEIGDGRIVKGITDEQGYAERVYGFEPESIKFFID